MSIQVVGAAYGRPALSELRGLISELKQDDALSPVSVLVPSNYVGVSTRRMLASGDLGRIANREGLAGIDLLTTYRLAELLGAPRLAAMKRRPLSTPVIAAGIRGVLRDTATMFSAVSEHPSTERALVRVHRDLRDLTQPQLDTLASKSDRAGEVVAIHRAVTERLSADWYDEFDLFDSATTIVAERPQLARERGHVVIYLPLFITAAGVRLIREVALHTPVTVLAGYTGAPDADHLVDDIIAKLGATKPDLDISTPIGTDIVTVSDADDEVRAVLRDVLAALIDGVPLSSMAILYGTDSPYARLLSEQLVGAGIPSNGATVRSIDESVIGRTVLALLDLPDHRFRRTDVLAIVASAPIRLTEGETALAPAKEWERISRDTGIVEGLEEWVNRLDQHERECLRNIERLGDDPEESRVRRAHRSIRHCSQLGSFVSELARALDPSTVPTSWSGKATWLRQLVSRYLGPETERTGWPEIEVLAAEKLDGALDRLAGLDEIETSPTLATFRRALELELEGGLGRSGNFGEGIFVGRVGQALGIDLERVFVLGMAEGIMPGRRHDDSLLPDQERAALEGALRLTTSRVEEDHRSFLAALGAARERRTLYFPRGDLRRSSERMPSRWLLDTISALNGSRVWSGDIDRIAREGHDWIREIPSFVGGLRGVEFPASDQEYELRSLLDHHEQGLAIGDHHLVDIDAGFGRAINLIASRNSTKFTRFDGNLAGVITSSGVRLDVVSPTRLENWAKCPHRFLMQNVLQVDVIERPELLLRISAMDKGSLVHEALDHFVNELLDEGADLPGPGHPWPTELEDRLAAIASELCETYAGRGLVGKEIFWKQDRRTIFAELMETLRQDVERPHRGEVVAAEFGFGLATTDVAAITYDINNGPTVSFRGSADRVERSASGQLIVIDYKTGKATDFSGIDKAKKDPVKRGTKLQLPVYALAARQVHGQPQDPVHAAYWFISNKGGYRWIGYDIDERVMSRFDEVLKIIIEGIGAGLFPANPPKGHYQFFVECPYCDPDGLGTLEKRREWERKRLDPALDPYLTLAEPEEPPDA